ncbi:hypothetical protein [Jiella marina]|uniref:hypothetical protein n=1 Tax=Jiella sp. LLJ827 TaxID=2917712 RepID=UPI002101C221|nr:hypothetical protein [Jiella sp. LLJ827]MCQ0986413.1 hypothetical protein [Jiella sp. LLJ827]
MTQVEYARHRGVSKQAVGKMVSSGKIPTVAGPQGRKLIDPAEADFRLGENRERIDVGRDYPDAPPPQASAIGGEIAKDGARAQVGPSSSSGLTAAKTVTEEYRSKIAKLEFEERMGRLLPLEDVQRAMERCAESMLRGIDQLPTKADDIATAFSRSGVAGVRDALKVMARDLKTNLSENMRLTAEAEEEEDE